jgi:hypothetical protein
LTGDFAAVVVIEVLCTVVTISWFFLSVFYCSCNSSLWWHFSVLLNVNAHIHWESRKCVEIVFDYDWLHLLHWKVITNSLSVYVITLNNSCFYFILKSPIVKYLFMNFVYALKSGCEICIIQAYIIWNLFFSYDYFLWFIYMWYMEIIPYNMWAEVSACFFKFKFTSSLKECFHRLFLFVCSSICSHCL